jgi:hypothetical protein
MTFYQWALSRPTECNPRGDYQIYLRNDIRAAHIANTREGWEAHLRATHATPGQRMAFRSLWGSYERCLAEQGLQLPQTPAPPPVATEQPATQMELIAL